MRTLRVEASRPYDILVGRGLLDQVGELSRQVNRSGRVMIVTDSHVGPLYAERVRRSYEEAGYEADVFTFAAGEENKRLAVIAELYARLANSRFGRGDLLAALGGGVAGDMTGFAAATWLRGVDFVQIPTSLLAQVDSSVGGKTGVDIPEGKNLVGAFWQPARVIADPAVLETLPGEMFADGLAEVVKSACIRDEGLFIDLENGRESDPEGLEEIIVRSIGIKRDVVERDENESGERKLLNFGHTMGHAWETFYHYTEIGRAHV